MVKYRLYIPSMYNAAQHVPAELCHVLSDDQWNELVESIRSTQRYGHFYACLTEILLYPILGPGIFGVHPYYSYCLDRTNILDKLNAFNVKYYGREYIIFLSGDYLVFNVKAMKRIYERGDPALTARVQRIERENQLCNYRFPPELEVYAPNMPQADVELLLHREYCFSKYTWRPAHKLESPDLRPCCGKTLGAALSYCC